MQTLEELRMADARKALELTEVLATKAKLETEQLRQRPARERSVEERLNKIEQRLGHVESNQAKMLEGK